jgi:hypothetical protein
MGKDTLNVVMRRGLQYFLFDKGQSTPQFAKFSHMPIWCTHTSIFRDITYALQVYV